MTRRNGTLRRSVIYPTGTEAKLIRWYNEGVTWREMADRTKLSMGHIQRILERNGIDFRKRKRLDLIKRVHRKMTERQE